MPTPASAPFHHRRSARRCDSSCDTPPAVAARSCRELSDECADEPRFAPLLCFCSPSLFIAHCRFRIADFENAETSIGNRQSKIGNVISQSSPVSASTAHRHNARPCLCRRRAFATCASPRTPGQAFVCRCRKPSKSSDIAEYFPWLSGVRLWLRCLQVTETQSDASNQGRKPPYVPARRLCNLRRRHPSVSKSLRSRPGSRCLPAPAPGHATPPVLAKIAQPSNLRLQL